MWTLPELNSCREVGPDLIEQTFALGSQPHPAQRVLRLLERMARVAKPDAEAHRILIVLARLASADWIGGRLELTLSDFGVATELDVRVDDGAGAKRWRSFSIAVPLAELSQWVRQWPREIHPLAPFGEPLAERLSLRAQGGAPGPNPLAFDGAFQPAPEQSAPQSGPSSRRPDPHRKATVRLQAVKVPAEAYPKPEPEARSDRDTARPPAPQPIVQPTVEPDATDDGWE